MAIVGGLDIHRRQITYDWIDTTTGESCRGLLIPVTRVELRVWLARVELPAMVRRVVELALRMIDHLAGELDRLDTDLARIARAQPGCQASSNAMASGG